MRAAAEAVVELLVRAHGERRRLLVVERAAGLVLAPGALQLHAAADHLDDVGAGDQLVDEVLGDAAGHGRIADCGWRIADSGAAAAASARCAGGAFARRRRESLRSGRGGGRAFRVRPGSRRKMLAGTDPDRTLDTRRLSEFSPRRENSHGARSVRRTPPHHRGAVESWVQRQPPRSTAAGSGPLLAHLSGYVRRASDRRAGRRRHLPAPPLLADQSLRRVPRGGFGVLFRRAFFFASRNRTPKPAPPPRPTAERGEQRERRENCGKSSRSRAIAQRAAGSGGESGLDAGAHRAHVGAPGGLGLHRAP